MASYHVLQIDSLIESLTLCNAGSGFVFQLDVTSEVIAQPNDLVLGYLTAPINEVRYIFEVESASGNSVVFKKIYETARGVEYDFSTVSELRPVAYQKEFFAIPEELFCSIAALLCRYSSREGAKIASKATGNPVQKIYYGCPGTGKSHEVKRLTSGLDNELVIRYDKDTTNIFRTTFHPDYDYASFVGCYKPIKEGEQPLDYRFIPQVFTKAYVTALQHPEDPIYLIIEEINRGNCAQIFGDLFQLLDRKEGVSEFPIIPDTDLSNYLYSLVLDGSEICLPANFNIYATMNTSDQSLFPMDSAFKRRWDMEYMSINYKQDEANFKITIGKDTYDWLEYLAYINKLIGKATDSEDKQMGEFFIRGDIDAKAFKNKVMFYLWNEVCKDLYNDRRPPQAFFFRDRNDKTFIFTDLFNPETGDKTLTEFFFYLKYGKNPTAEAPAMDVQELEEEDNDNQ